MGKKDFDNLFHLQQLGTTLATSTTVSTEVDFELPRGYIAKIYKIILEWVAWHEDLDTLNVEADLGVRAALIRDPDDITTVVAPENTSQHDVVAEAEWSFYTDDTGANVLAGSVIYADRKIIDIPEHIDLITARNMRFNGVGLGSSVALLTESAIRTEIYYTLERITDADILALLDIL